jgi:hypothetical protein
MFTEEDLAREKEAREHRAEEMRKDGQAAWRQALLDGRKSFTGVSTEASRARDAKRPHDRHLDFDGPNGSRGRL